MAKPSIVNSTTYTIIPPLSLKGKGVIGQPLEGDFDSNAVLKRIFFKHLKCYEEGNL